MTEPIRPVATKLFTKENWIFVASIASISAPTDDELTAMSVLDFTNALFDQETERPNFTPARVQMERRIGDGQIFEGRGTGAWNGGTFVYAFGAQGAAMSDGKKFYEKIPEGTAGFLVERLGVAKATAVAASQFVNVYPVEFDLSTPIRVGSGDTAESAMQAAVVITSAPALNIAVVEAA